MYDVQFTEQAAKDIRSLPKFTKDQVKKAIERMREEPRGEGLELTRELKGFWSWHVGDYRIVYEIAETLTILTVGHRSGVYLSDVLRQRVSDKNRRDRT